MTVYNIFDANALLLDEYNSKEYTLHWEKDWNKWFSNEFKTNHLEARKVLSLSDHHVSETQSYSFNRKCL